MERGCFDERNHFWSLPESLEWFRVNFELLKNMFIFVNLHTQKCHIGLPTSRQQDVFELLVTSCQQVRNNLLTTCNNLVEIIRLVAGLFSTISSIYNNCLISGLVSLMNKENKENKRPRQRKQRPSVTVFGLIIQQTYQPCLIEQDCYNLVLTTL
jgi:hypothetical protein